MTEVSNHSNVNYAAFATVTGLAVATGVAVFTAATTASTIAMIFSSIFAVGGAAATGAGITAWIHKDSTTVSKYFDNFQSHVGFAVAGSFTFVSQMLVQALIKGLVEGISKAISRKIAGPDQKTEVTVTHRHA